MIDKFNLVDYFKNNINVEFSKEELINTFSKSVEDENEIDQFLSEIEVKSTFVPSNILVNCKGGTVYFKWME
ncbi:MAG TPA: hypothetical protein VIY08_12730 [Candidatus Nitrosocosmicus sp.]